MYADDFHNEEGGMSWIVFGNTMLFGWLALIWKSDDSLNFSIKAIMIGAAIANGMVWANL